jgi:hypothetical protein
MLLYLQDLITQVEWRTRREERRFPLPAAAKAEDVEPVVVHSHLCTGRLISMI